MYRYYKRHAGVIALHIFSCLVTALSYLIMALLLGKVAETAMAGEFHRLWPLIVGTLAYLVVDTALDFFYQFSRAVAVQRISRDLRKDLVNKIASLTWEEQKRHDSGWYAAMMVEDVPRWRGSTWPPCPRCCCRCAPSCLPCPPPS